MAQNLKIDFVSDVSCPWCIIGLKALETALARLNGTVAAEMHFHPFELNPQMGPDGQNIVEHIGEKYGSTPEQSAQARVMIKERAADLGFEMRMHEGSRIYNTFDAHRLLHWAEAEGKQAALKHAMFKAYFTDGAKMSDHETLVKVATSVGLDEKKARQILADGTYTDDVRAEQAFYRQQGINAVPAIVINEKYLISGGQPVDVFERALREIAQEN
ncbi:DsbA family oxidoreductase [Dongia rigui]|uniref:DsbA family oxidoreductase n=1 Tax=Dongia rigui TaxID=940149 RepID=A0ABU5DZD3_9PROT|nr:DsbA family oxidoreductase [Dongia rigui]MDY0872678.1 DsbA family oxidoreductase [Dongia rigui]